MNVRRLTLILLAVLTLAVAGCGGDDSSDAVAEAETTAVEETTSGDDPTEDVETVPDLTDGELGGECAELAGIGARLSQSLTGQSSDLGAAADALDEIAEQVPEEIKDDYEVIAANFEKIAEALEGVDLSNPNAETVEKFQQATASLDSDEVTEATANVQAWVTANC